MPGLAVDIDADGIQDATETSLLNTYAPVVILHSSEGSLPANVDWYLQRTRMRFHHGGGCPDCAVQYTPDQSDLNSYLHRKRHSLFHIPPCDHYGGYQRSWADYDPNQCFFVQMINDSDHGGTSTASDWLIYGHVYPRALGGLIVQYWFFYPYNDGMLTQNHEGDWETVSVELDGPIGGEYTISGLVYYRHGDPEALAPHEVDWFSDTHPVVYTGRGSHASYESTARCQWYMIGFREWGCAACEVTEECSNAWFTWSGGRPAGSPGLQGGGVVNVGERVPDQWTFVNGQQFIYYSGRWGELGNPIGGDPFSGPRGPAYQDSWNRNRAPHPDLGVAFVDDDFDSSTPGWGIDRFDSIYAGVFAVHDGGTVYVSAGTYPEKFVISKPVNLVGVDGREVTFIDGQNQSGSPVIKIEAQNIWISGFTIQNGSAGIEIYESAESTITRNTIRNFTWGIIIEWDSADNKIYHNDFVDNLYFHVSSIDGGTNEWSYGQPPGGNYWDDYTGVDTNGDGIGESPYDIFGNDDEDAYPFVTPGGWQSLPAAAASAVRVGPDAGMNTCPAGDAAPFEHVVVHLVNAAGENVVGFPASHVSLTIEPGEEVGYYATQSHPLGCTFTAIDQHSNEEGDIRFAMRANTSIVGDIVVKASVQDIEIPATGTVLCNSVDGNHDGAVNLTDTGIFTTAFHNAVYDWEQDFSWDGAENLTEVSLYATHIGHGP
jgi:parallel beta-helix repeat protein